MGTVVKITTPFTCELTLGWDVYELHALRAVTLQIPAVNAFPKGCYHKPIVSNICHKRASHTMATLTSDSMSKLIVFIGAYRSPQTVRRYLLSPQIGDSRLVREFTGEYMKLCFILRSQLYALISFPSATLSPANCNYSMSQIIHDLDFLIHFTKKSGGFGK